MQSKSVRREIGKVIGTVVWLVAMAVLLQAQVAQAALKPNYLTFRTNQGTHVQIDLHDAGAVAEFREAHKDDPFVSNCFVKADYAVKTMGERDAGVTLLQHLDKLEARYEASKDDPQGAIPWLMYSDSQRMVRDIHRSAGSHGQGGYRYTNSTEVWAREFKWCALPY